MSLNLTGAFTALVALVDSCASVQNVIQGEPLSLPASVSAYVNIGTPRPVDQRTSGLIMIETEYLVTFGFRVAGTDESGPELKLCAAIQEFILAFYADRKAGSLGGTVESMELDFSPAGLPEFRPVAGQEFRLFPVIVRVKQQQTT